MHLRSLLTATLAAATLLVTSPAGADLVKDEGRKRTSNVSGYSGKPHWTDAGTHYALNGLSMYELHDKPCIWSMWSRDLDETGNGREGSTRYSACGKPKAGSGKKVVRLGGGYFIHGIQICTNKKKDTRKARLKGVKLFAAKLDKRGDVTRVDKVTAKFQRSHCRKWHKVVRCGKNKIAFGIQFHSGDRGLSGAALLCYEVKKAGSHTRPD